MSRRSIVLFSILAFIALWLAACGGGAGGGNTGGGSALNVTVNATEFKFDPSTITATPGQTVNLTVKNNGTIQHTWVQTDSNVKLTIDAGKTATTTFTVPSKAGTYTFDCDVAGHKESGMVGQLVVK